MKLLFNDWIKVVLFEGICKKHTPFVIGESKPSTNILTFTKNGNSPDLNFISFTADSIITLHKSLDAWSIFVDLEKSDKIFEAYYRERKKTDGFGLGLNLVKSICDEDNVDISIIENNEAIRFEYTFKKGQEWKYFY